MAIPPRSRIPPRGDLRHFPPTNGPVLLLAPDRRSIGIYQVPQNTVVFFGPPTPPPQPPPPPPPVPPAPLPILFGNTAQTCVNECPGSVGALFAWGLNANHQLGVGDDLPRSIPVIVEEEDPGVHWTDISLARFHGLGVKSDGSLWSWGQNQQAQLGNGFQSVYPDTSHDFFRPTRVGTDSDWVAVSANSFHSLGLKSDGTIWGWGDNNSGQLGLGELVEYALVPTQIGTEDGWSQVAAGRLHSLFLKANGDLWGTGSNTSCQLGPPCPTEYYEPVQIDGSWSWVAAGDANSHGIKTDGTLWKLTTAIEQIGSDSDWVSVKGGPSSVFIIALKNDGTLWGMGNNSAGSLGLGDTTNRSVMTQIGTDTWVNYSASRDAGHVLAVRSDGTLWGWGPDSTCQLGQATATSNRLSPIQIGPDAFWLNAAAGFQSSIGLRSTVNAPPPPAGISGVALGGSVTIAGGFHIHIFVGSGTFQVIDGAGVLFDVLYAGGGGGGGPLGGGGAGEFAKQTGISIANGTYAVLCGARGLGGGGTENPGNDGGTTSFNGTSVIGGGGGGAHTSGSARNGRNGASGGGGGGDPSGPGAAGGIGSTGNDGGSGDGGIINFGGGGGGGNAEVGENGSPGNGGDGGDGTSDSVTGGAVFYCAGGGGKGDVSPGLGGSPVFGLTAGGSASDIGASEGAWGATPGSGGGAGNVGGDGARGAVIIRYPSPV